MHNIFKTNALCCDMFEFLSTSTVQYAISIALLAWSLVWQLLAMWKAAMKKHRIWFVALFLVGLFASFSVIISVTSTFGILSILYFFIFSRFSVKDEGLVFERWGKKKKSRETKK